MRRFLSITVGALMLLATACSKPPKEGPGEGQKREAPPSTAPHKSPGKTPDKKNTPAPKLSDEESESLLDFAARFSARGLAMLLDDKNSNKDGSGENMALSPYSVYAVFSMLYDSLNGPSAKEVASVFHFLAPERQHKLIATLDRAFAAPQEGVEVATAYHIWFTKVNLTPKYRDILARYYGVDRSIRPGPLKADVINKWVQKKTRDMIKRLIDQKDIDPLTRIIMVNALYFKALWATQFDPKDTEPQKFRTLSGNEVKVPMMSKKLEVPYLRVREDHLPCAYKMVKLPYKGKQWWFIAVLPLCDGEEANLVLPGESQDKKKAAPSPAERKKRILDFVSKLTKADFDRWLQASGEQEVRVSIPKFTINLEHMLLNKTLMALGLKKAFSELLFQKDMVESSELLYIKMVLQSVRMEVDEKGTKAAAATAVVIATKGIHITPSFTADRPFLVFIVHQPTKTVAFSALVGNPSVSK